MRRYTATITKKANGEEHPVAFEIKPEVTIGMIIELEKMLNRFAIEGVEFTVNANILDPGDAPEPSGDRLDQGDRNG